MARRSSRAAWVGVFICALIFQFSQFSLAQTSAWDPGLPKDSFKDDVTPPDKKNPKKPQKPTHRLAKTDCDDCQKIVDKLQNALDDWYALELADANATISKSVRGEDTDVSQADARAQKEDALAGLGQKERPPPKGKTKDDVKKELKKLSDDLQNCLKKCATSPTPTPTPTPTEKPPNDGNQPGNAEQPVAPGPKPECVLKIDFIINKGATLDSNGTGKQTQAEEEKEIDDYLQKLNKTFSGSDVGFERNSLTHVNDPNRPEYPETGGEENKASKEQTDVAKEAEAEAKKLKNKGNITVKIVHNFHDKDKPDGSPASIQGITIGPTILIVDPWDVKRNTLGGETWDHTLAHELGHRLGLDHTVLPSDKNYENQEKGVYKPPNVMSPGHGRTNKPDEFTPDQIAEMKKRYENEFCKPGQTQQPPPTPTPPPTGGRGTSKTPTPKPGRPKRAPRIATGGGNISLPQESFCSLIGDNKIDAEITGTGETIGHIADAKITNFTDEPIEVAIPPGVLESRSGKNQDYGVPHTTDVVLQPHESKTIPLDGVCLDRHKPPVGKGVGDDLAFNDCDPDARIARGDSDRFLRIAESVYDAADKLEEDGKLKEMPYKDPKKRKEIVEQWATWIRTSEVTGDPPPTKDDLKKVVEKQVGKVPPDKQKKIDEGIDTIFDKIELTTEKAKDLEKENANDNEGTEQGAPGGNTYEISDNTPTPQPGTQEKKKKEGKKKKDKKKKYPPEIQKWVDAMEEYDKLESDRLSKEYDYKQGLKKWGLEHNQHYKELNDAVEKAKQNIKDGHHAQEDYDKLKKAQEELDKFGKEVAKDFNKTEVGKGLFKDFADAEDLANKQKARAEEAGKDIDPEVKKQILEKERD